MPQVVGIRFKQAGRLFYFDPAGLELEVNNYVVVETARGLEVGRVVIAPKQVLESELAGPLKPVLRKAEPQDLEKAEGFKRQEAEALAQGRALVAKSGLSLRLLSAEYSLERNRLTFYFCAEERVDFRELLREMGVALHSKVELRQVGARDAAKLVGGIGPCGFSLCCATHLCNFVTVSMKMAKEQDLPLNPGKLSGLCGRLLCCLAYEYEQYHALREKLPAVGQKVTTSMGPATVVGSNVLKETVLLRLESEALVELPSSALAPSEA